MLDPDMLAWAMREGCAILTFDKDFGALALAPGALNTGTPRALMAFTGTLLVPAPARAIASTPAGISMSCMLCERTMMASGAAMSVPVA